MFGFSSFLDALPVVSFKGVLPMEFVAQHLDEILATVGAVVTAASMIVALTPSTKDDEVLGRVVKFIEKFSVVAKRTK